jgi:response regulator RpfG family c-di-GMP phosphodiesterase
MTMDAGVVDSPGETAARGVGVGWTLLCVDDEPSIVSSIRRALRSEGYRVLGASSGPEALEVLEHESVDLVISDMRMPGMDGAQLLEQVHLRWPQTVRILLTGYADMAATIAAINKGRIYRYVNKPWDDAELRVAIHQALERVALQREKDRLEALTQAQNEELRTLNATLEHRVELRTGELAQATDRLKKSYLSSIRVFSNLLELRGGQLVGHSRRVADLARRVAVAMEVPDAEVQQIFVAGLLHDIGLIGVPDSVLSKPVPRLAPEDMEHYARHAASGEQALIGLDDMQPVATLIRSHHERFDGKGFPDCLAGAFIPLGARILAVVDSYDELQCGRMGGSHLSSAEARTFMRQGMGTQFDPEVLQVFLQITEPSMQQRPSGPPSIPVRANELHPDMVLARDLVSPSGVVMLAADQRLSAALIVRIREYERREGLELVLHVKPARK